MSRKYTTEFGVGMESRHVALLQEDYLHYLTEEPRPPQPQFHIYAVCRRPRISIDPAKFRADSHTTSGTFIVQYGSTSQVVEFECPNHPNPIVRVESDWPHTSMKLMRANDEVAYFGKTALFAPYLSEEIRKHLDLEVLYIGQSYGSGGTRTAPERLQSHSRLQQILGETSRQCPDQEVWLCLVEFAQLLFSDIDPRQKADRSQEEDSAHIAAVTSAPVSEEQAISYAEAGLINYFKPRFNEKFKHLFPSPSHSTYSQCYDLDMNALFIALDTENIHCKLYSESAERQFTHTPRFELHDRAGRVAMFDVLRI